MKSSSPVENRSASSAASSCWISSVSSAAASGTTASVSSAVSSVPKSSVSPASASETTAASRSDAITAVGKVVAATARLKMHGAVFFNRFHFCIAYSS